MFSKPFLIDDHAGAWFADILKDMESHIVGVSLTGLPFYVSQAVAAKELPCLVT